MGIQVQTSFSNQGAALPIRLFEKLKGRSD
jgi:hypothetical protein